MEVESTYITKEVAFDLNEIIDCDLESFLDLAAEAAGHPLLMDISYRLVGSRVDDAGNVQLLIEISGSTELENQ